MFPLPQYFGLDFSAALPWILTGILIGLFLSLLWRLIRGPAIRRRIEARVREVEALLEEARSDHQTEVARLVGDSRNFEIALADAERRALAAGEAISKLRSDAQRAGKMELAARDELLAATGEIEKLRKSLQWAETQTLNLQRDKQSIESQIQAFASERQTLAADLATARTAAELKSAEITRLLNQVTWQEERVASNSAGKAEVERVQSELQSAQGYLRGVQAELTARNSALATAQSDLERKTKDLDYIRNLAYWQASEVQRLRDLVTALQGDVAAKEKLAASLLKQVAAWTRRGGGGLIARRGQALGLAANGLAMSGPGKHTFARRSATTAKKLARVKAYKPGKAIALAGRGKSVGSDGEPLMSGFAARRLAARRASITATGSDEMLKLKSQLAELTEDAQRYRRLREAVNQANRIAEEEV